jgi:hypothetical protein
VAWSFADRTEVRRAPEGHGRKRGRHLDERPAAQRGPPADRGDVLEEPPDALVVRFGNAEVITIARSAIALMTRRTGTATLPAKPFAPAAGGARTSAG